MSNWIERACGNCGDDFVYHVDWENIPDLCKPCIAEKREARAKWHEKDCSCGKTIKYHEDWNRVPDLCQECIAEKKAKWQVKSCPCGADIRYHADWEKVPSRCKECNAWQSKECAAQGCSGAIQYKSYWERVPTYCKACKDGEKRITVQQRKDDGSVHEYEGRGFVNRQGVAVFKDDGSSGKHSHAVYDADGSLKGKREEGRGEDWVNEPVNVSFSSTRSSRATSSQTKQNRFTTPYKDRSNGKHVHDFSRQETREIPGQKGRFEIRHQEAAGENAQRRGGNKK